MDLVWTMQVTAHILTFTSSIIHAAETFSQTALAAWALPIALGQIHQLFISTTPAGAHRKKASYLRLSGAATHACVPREDSASLVVVDYGHHCETGVKLFHVCRNSRHHSRNRTRASSQQNLINFGGQQRTQCRFADKGDVVCTVAWPTFVCVRRRSGSAYG